MKPLRYRAWFILPLIVIVAFLLRAALLWWTRPEFMGWFNHAPWYWVQTRELLDHGVLPFADLPLIFHVYAVLTSGLTTMGMDTTSAIVHAQRFCMSLIPALLALPVWQVMRLIHGERRLGWPGWLLVATAAFLPLNFSYMPELLQKNVLGLLLLAWLMQLSFRAMQRPGWLLLAGPVFGLIALTHLGTLTAAVLWLVALATAALVERQQPAQRMTLLGASLVALLLGGLSLRHFDPAALDRITDFLLSGWRNSALGGLFGPTTLVDIAGNLAVCALAFALPLCSLVGYRRVENHLVRPAKIFWMATSLFTGLLILPVFDLDVLPRFVLFLPLPLLFVMGFQLVYGRRERWSRFWVVAAAAGSLVMMLGEIADLLRPQPDKVVVLRELHRLKSTYRFTEQDLVLAPYAVGPQANWFLGSSAGVVTALNKDDANRYARIFILNTGWEQTTAVGDLQNVHSDADRYRAMRRAVPVPDGMVPEPGYAELRFYRLTKLPEDWVFDENGRWAGVRAQSSP